MAAKDKTDLNDSLVVRVNAKAVTEFKKRSIKKTGKTYTLLLREVIDAFNQGRLRIIPTNHQVENQLNTGELYDVTGK